MGFMSKGYLLDTNIAIAILINEHTAIQFAKRAFRDKIPIYFSTITVSRDSDMSFVQSELEVQLIKI
jgi:predicted nucleic acid-binding protein